MVCKHPLLSRGRLRRLPTLVMVLGAKAKTIGDSIITKLAPFLNRPWLHSRW